MSRKTTILICLVILLAGGGLTTLIFSTEPTAQQTGATRESAMLVDVTQAVKGDFTPTVSVMGTVQPSQDIMLSPRVSGQITSRSPSFTPGGYVREGEILLQIDSADYRNELMQRKSELEQAQADLVLELGRHQAAQKEYQLFGDTLSAENRARLLREPQLNSARASVNSAQAAVEQAQLQLQRSTIRAPYDAYVLSRNVNIGSQVAPGETLGRLVGLDTYWVEATVPQSKLRMLTFPQDDAGEGSEVTIRNRTAWGPDEYRTGNLYRLIGALEQQTRFARVLVEVDDPLSYREDNTGKPSLMIGSYVELDISGRQLDDVVRVSRDYVRDGDTIWIMNEDGNLDIRQANIVFEDATYAYVSEGVEEGERIVTTNIATISQGAPLRLQGSADNDNGATAE